MVSAPSCSGISAAAHIKLKATVFLEWHVLAEHAAMQQERTRKMFRAWANGKRDGIGPQRLIYEFMKYWQRLREY